MFRRRFPPQVLLTALTGVLPRLTLAHHFMLNVQTLPRQPDFIEAERGLTSILVKPPFPSEGRVRMLCGRIVRYLQASESRISAILSFQNHDC